MGRKTDVCFTWPLTLRHFLHCSFKKYNAACAHKHMLTRSYTSQLVLSLANVNISGGVLVLKDIVQLEASKRSRSIEASKLQLPAFNGGQVKEIEMLQRRLDQG